MIVGLLLLFYFAATAGLGIFWVARQELPVFDWHYLFGYVTLVLVCGPCDPELGGDHGLLQEGGTVGDADRRQATLAAGLARDGLDRGIGRFRAGLLLVGGDNNR